MSKDKGNGFVVPMQLQENLGYTVAYQIKKIYNDIVPGLVLQLFAREDLLGFHSKWVQGTSNVAASEPILHFTQLAILLGGHLLVCFGQEVAVRCDRDWLRNVVLAVEH